MKSTSLRGKGAAALVASMALVGSAATITTAPAQSAVADGDCKAPYPVSELTDDQAVTGLTVVKGTEPVGFSGTYLGKLDGGIAPGVDMLLFEMDFADDRLDEVGIWQGMSGSPVYAEDGRLIGAVAYGLAWGPSLVAGVTPYEEMDDYLTADAPATIKVSARKAAAIAAQSEVTTTQVAEGFRQLPMPMAISGIDRHRLRQMRKHGPESLNLRHIRAGSGGTSADTAGPESLIAGGNLGAAISYGDITTGGVGTVTSVCDGRLVGFGHPMTFGGRTTLGLMPADAVYVHGDTMGPGFKLANMGLPAGTIDEDHLTGISGDLGVLPPETDVSSTVTYGARNRTGTSHSLSPDYNADVTFSQILANHDRVVDAIQGGSENASYTIEGSTADGSFEIAFGDRYTSDYDISFEAIFDVADAVWALSQMEGVTVDDVVADAQVIDSTATWRIRALRVRQHGHWVKATRRSRVVTRAGGTLRLRTILTHGDRTLKVPMRLAVPARARREGYLQVTGGASVWSSAVYRADTPAELERALENGVRNDQVKATLVIPKRGRNLRVTDVSAPQDLVVRGGKGTGVRIRR